MLMVAQHCTRLGSSAPPKKKLTIRGRHCDQEGSPLKVRPSHCTSIGLTLAITPNVGNSSVSESHVELVDALDSGGPAPGLPVPSFGGSQPSLSDLEVSDPVLFDPAPGMPDSASAVVAAVPGTPEPASAVVTADPVSRSMPPPRKRFVDLPPSGFSSQQEADVLACPYRGILPRTSYACVC